MLHYQPSLAKPGIRIWSSSNDWAQSGHQESAAPEVPRCQVDARKALPGRRPRTSITSPKIPSLTLLTGREFLRIPPVVPLIGDQRYYGRDTVGIRGYEWGSGDGPEGERLALANR
jgi:hypothetical protein